MTVQADTKIIMKEKHKRRSDTDLVYGPNKDVSFKNRLKKPFRKNRGKSCSDDVPVSAVVVGNGNRNSLLSFMFCSFSGSGSSRRPRANEFIVDLDDEEDNCPYMKKDVDAEIRNTPMMIPAQVEEKHNTENELNNNTTVVPDDHTECQQKHESENKKNTESQAVQSPVAPVISSYNKKTHNFLTKLMNLKNAFIKAKVLAQLSSNTSSSSYGGGKPCNKDHTISTKGKTCVYNIEQTRDRSSLIISINGKNNEKRSSIVISLQDLTARKNSSQKSPMENRNRSSTSSSILFSGMGDDEMDLSYLIEFANQAFDHQVYNFENSADGPDGERDTGDFSENSFIDCKDDDEPAEWVDGPSCVEENDKSFEMLNDQEALNSLHEAIAKFEDSGLENSQNDFNEFEESLLFGGRTEDIMTFNEDDIRVVFQRAPHVLSGIDRHSMCESLHLADGDDDDIIIANGPDLAL